MSQPHPYTPQPFGSDGQSSPAAFPMPDSAVMPAPAAQHAAQAAAQFGQPESDPAVEMIRRKIQNLYVDEPSAAEEIKQAAQHTHPGSIHQQYMEQLNNSGMSLVEIQNAWHAYYTALPEHEKYQVWQEFYVTNGGQPAAPAATQAPMQTAIQAAAPAASAYGQPEAAAQQFPQLPQINPITAAYQASLPGAVPAAPKPASTYQYPAARPERPERSGRTRGSAAQAAARLKSSVHPEQVSDIKKRILHTVKSVAGATAGSGTHKPRNQHFQSLFFGLGSGALVLLVVLFSFFNELFIAPLIQPSRNIKNTPVIVDVASTVVSGGPKVIIPKINVEIPVDYTQKTTDEKAIELALDNGVVHYPTTSRPGEVGNAAYFGHSSNNIFNPGKYKFAFVLLHELIEGDVFYLTNDNKTYAYRVFSKRIVKPTEVSVLDPVPGKSATATLITCDPPGTSINRLVVVGEQISPDASGNPVPAAPEPETAAASEDLPGNGPSLWSRIWGSIF